MPTTRLPDSAPPPSDDNHSILGLIMAILAAMPAAQCNAILTLLDFLNGLPREELALLAKAVQPHLTDPEIATLCAVSDRQLYRYKRFQAFKSSAADYWRDHRETSYRPDEPAA